MDNQEEKKTYEEYVKEMTPVRELFPSIAKAFILGGSICLLGQIIINVCRYLGLNVENAASVCTMVLIALSMTLTGTGIYPLLANWGGAGALVPITGFANSVAAPAIEYKKEGQVFGIGCKIFTIAGPVILYGICVSAVLGVFFWIQMRWNIL